MNKNILTNKTIDGLSLIKQGKVRDIYDCGDSLLIVTSDRMSAFDVVMDDPIPDKGKVLNQISLFWFSLFKDEVENHVISADPSDYPAECMAYADALRGRSMLVKKAEPLPVECIVRGYITGSGWSEYLKKGSVCGINLPSGIKESEKLTEPLFTPSTKADEGHDENIDFNTAVKMLGQDIASEVKRLSIKLYSLGRDYAAERGIIVADTKFEFGIRNGKIILIDEVLTPDSSRFWPMDLYCPGRGQQSFDKQYLRDYLSSIGWSKTPPPPALPEVIIEKTREKYIEAHKWLTGKDLIF